MSCPQVDFFRTSLHSKSLIAKRRRVVSSVTLLHQLEILKQTGRYDAFKLQWHPSYDDPPMVWPIPNHLFWDSDVAKWIEGACYFLHDQPNAEIELAIEELVEMIRGAQQPDGYINIHFTVVQPGKRFTNLRDFHEMYNAGHLIEAALAHNALYRDDRLLAPILQYVDLLCDTFGPNHSQTHGYPGHPEIELALLRLYQLAGNRKHLELARYFIMERGNRTGCNGRNYFDWEAEQRGDDLDKRPIYYAESSNLWYYQAHAPIVEQKAIEGHSVRAMYLLTAAANLIYIDGGPIDSDLNTAVLRLWDNMVEKKMYVTGGIGAIKQWEGFGLEYFLPQGTDEGGCYSETCAALGVMMLAERLLQIDQNSKFADIMELCLYNSVLTAMSYDGKEFTYVNQLASSGTDLSKREGWFTCACCPPNILRVFGHIGGYIWTHKVDNSEQSAHVNVHLFIPGTIDFMVNEQKVQVEQESDWPWSGDIKFSLRTELKKVSMKLRIPGWATSWKLSPESPQIKNEKGYLVLPEDWLAENPTFILTIPLRPRLISPHPFTNQETISVARGPIIYCVEDYDNAWVEDHFRSVQISPECKFMEEPVVDSNTGDSFISLKVLDGASVITQPLQSMPSISTQELESKIREATPIAELNMIPYFFRANRGGKGQMRVGLAKWKKT